MCSEPTAIISTQAIMAALFDGVRTFDNQRFGFSLTWNFGNQQAKARQRSRSAIDEEMRRISED
jgi:hypothetical protein